MSFASRVGSAIAEIVQFSVVSFVAFGPLVALAAEPKIEFDRNDDTGQLRVLLDGKEAIVYQYAKDLDLVHYFPVRSPSGKSMTVQHPNPYPHHRSFWFGDQVKLDGGRKVSLYASLYSKVDKSDPKSAFRDHVRHVEFVDEDTTKDTTKEEPIVRTKLLWEMDRDKPVMDEERTMRVVALGGGEYFLDMTFVVTATYGDVTFASDWVHYAWPYIRMNTAFSVEQGGTIINSAGGKNQKETNEKVADWVDYTNTIEGQTEGLAIFSHSDNEKPHKWLTRDYGCFGPRRIDAKSGKTFTVKKGESITRRVGVLVHQGDVTSGKVASRYADYIEGKL